MIDRKDSWWWRQGYTLDWWQDRSQEERMAFLSALADDEIEEFVTDWRVWARDKQLPPDSDWRTWLIKAGRGFGKTRTAVEYILEEIQVGYVKRVAIVGQGLDDIRTVMIEGDSGFIACGKPGNVPKYLPTVGGGRLIWPNGAVAFVYSAEDTEALRGPQFHLAWFDEPMAVPAEKRERALANLRMGLRLPVLGSRPRLILSTTPKKHRWMKEMVEQAENPKKRLVMTEGSTYENAANLAEDFIEMVVEDYEGTRLGQQEIHGMLLGDEEGALWTSETLDKQRMRCPDTDDGHWPTQLLVAFAHSCDKVVVAVDPNLKAGSKVAHAAGVVVVARRGKKRYVLADRSTKGGPAAWSKAAVQAYIDFDADEIIAETNQGGDMVRMVVNQAADELDVDVKFHATNATKGKVRRAEPVAAAYERGIVHHLGFCGTRAKPGKFYALEEQMTSVHDGSDPTGEDFDRLDALVWGLVRLKIGKASSASSGAGAGAAFSFKDFGANG